MANAPIQPAQQLRPQPVVFMAKSTAQKDYEVQKKKFDLFTATLAKKYLSLFPPTGPWRKVGLAMGGVFLMVMLGLTIAWPPLFLATAAFELIYFYLGPKIARARQKNTQSAKA